MTARVVPGGIICRHVPHPHAAAQRHSREAVDREASAPAADHVADEKQDGGAPGARGRDRVLAQPAVPDEGAGGPPRRRAQGPNLAADQGAQLRQLSQTQTHNGSPESSEDHQDVVELTPAADFFFFLDPKTGFLNKMFVS